MRLKVKLQKIYFRLYNSVFATRPSLRLCVSVAGNYIEMMRGDMLDVGGDVVMVPNIDLETGDCLPEDVTIPSQTTTTPAAGQTRIYTYLQFSLDKRISL